MATPVFVHHRHPLHDAAQRVQPGVGGLVGFGFGGGHLFRLRFGNHIRPGLGRSFTSGSAATSSSVEMGLATPRSFNIR